MRIVKSVLSFIYDAVGSVLVVAMAPILLVVFFIKDQIIPARK